MGGPVVAIPHYSNPDVFPHITRFASALAAAGARPWAIGFGSASHTDHATGAFFRKDLVSLPMEGGFLHFFTFFLKVFLVLWREHPAILQPIDTPALIPCLFHSLLRRIPLYYFTLEDTPSISSFVGRPIRRRIWTLAERAGIGRARAVAVVADIDAEVYMKRYGIPRPRVVRNVPRLRPLKSDDELLLRRRFGWSREQNVLIYHGIIDSGRGIENAFPSLARHEDWRLAIAGGGCREGEVMSEARRAGLEKQIGRVGRYRYEDLGLWLQDADVGFMVFDNVSPGAYQALPCKLFECVHSCVPVVASDFPEMRSYITSTGVGLVVDPLDREAIDEALVRLLTDSDLYTSCKAACGEERKRTNWEAESSRYLSFLGLARQ